MTKHKNCEKQNNKHATQQTNQTTSHKSQLLPSAIEFPPMDHMDFVVDGGAKVEIIQALRGRDPEESKIGVCGPGNIVNGTLEIVIRLAKEYELFDKIVTATVTKKKPDLSSIQTQIGAAIGLNFDDDDDEIAVTAGTGGFCMCFGGGNKKKKKRLISEDRAKLVCSKLKEFQSVLVILYDINGRLDLGKLGIPFGEHHQGCKILLASSNEEVLSNNMKVHKLIHTIKTP